MNIQSSFTVYTAALHALTLNYLLLAYYWLGLSWIELALLYFNKQKLFIIQNKQQDTLQQQQAAGEAKTQCSKHYKPFFHHIAVWAILGLLLDDLLLDPRELA